MAFLEVPVLLCNVEGSQDLHRVGNEAVDADTDIDDCDVSVDRLEVEDKDGFTVALVRDVCDHCEDHKEG